MWFRMPVGCGAITVERVEFKSEITDKEGFSYFRAQEAFAPKILAIEGFAVAEPPEDAPDDLPRADPLRDGALAQFAIEAEAMKMEIQNLRMDLGASVAKGTSLENENSDLQKQLEESRALVAELQEKLEDKPVAKALVKG